MRGANWSDEEIATLTEWWDDGMSAGEIARRLGTHTEKAVQKKVEVLNLLPHERQRKPKLKKPAIGVLPKLPGPVDLQPHPGDPKPARLRSGAAITLLNAERRHCRWPVGVTAPFQSMRICGNRTHNNSSWCYVHYLRAFYKAV